MVIVPDLITAAPRTTASIDLNLWKAVQTALISHCEQNGNRMAILDAPPEHEPAADQGMAQRRSPCTTRPTPRCTTPGSRSRTRSASTATPRSSCRRRATSPASGRAPTRPAACGRPRPTTPSAASSTSSARSRQNEQGLLNPIGINCIRPFGTRGIRIWGARTLSSDTDWRYINVRRLFNMIEATILEGTQYAVFEPNDMSLWEGVKRTLNGVPARPVVGRRAVRLHRRPGLLRQVRRGDQPAGVDRRRQARRRGRHLAGQAGRVRGVPYQPAEAVRRPDPARSDLSSRSKENDRCPTT